MSCRQTLYGVNFLNTVNSKDRRLLAKERTREQILDAARELFAAYGFEAVTMRRIAARIGYTPTTIYLYFPDKNSLVRELCTQDFRTLAATLSALGAVADPVERLRKLGYAYLDFALTHPNHYRLMFMETFPEEPAGVTKGNPDEDAYALLRASVADVVAAGLVRSAYADVDLAAQMLWSMMHGLASLQISKGEHQWVNWHPAERIAEQMMAMVESTILVAHG